MLIGVIPGAGIFYLNHVPGTPRYYLIPGPGHPPSKPPDRQLVVSTHAQNKIRQPAGVRMFTRGPNLPQSTESRREEDRRPSGLGWNNFCETT